MTEELIKAFLIEKTEQMPGNRLRNEPPKATIHDLIETFRDSLPKKPAGRFICLLEGFIGGELGLIAGGGRFEAEPQPLWVTLPKSDMLRETNFLIRMALHFDTMLLLGDQVWGPCNVKRYVQELYDFIDDQPVIRMMKETGCDYIDFCLLMGLLKSYADQDDYTDLHKLCRQAGLPQSYKLRLRYRLVEERSLLVNEELAVCSIQNNLHFLLCLTPKAIELIVNPGYATN